MINLQKIYKKNYKILKFTIDKILFFMKYFYD